MRLAASVLGALLLASCSSAPPPPPADGRPAASAQRADAGAKPATATASPTKESAEVARTLGRVSKLRGVKATRTVPGVTLDRTALVGKIKDKATREYPPDTLRREGQLLQLLGFAPPTFDYLGQLMTLLEAQLEGFYEPKDETMYLAGDLHGAEAEATLAHELVHALQDQNWDLKSRSDYRPGKGDETLALACLAEGDATSVMIDYLLAEQGRSALDLPDDMLREMMGSEMNGPKTQGVPHVLRTSLVAPYIDGLSFVHGLRRKGGWAMVDRAWQKPPTTTEQILHLDKWQANEPALTVPPPPAQTLGTEYKRDDEDTFGELSLALMYEEWLGAPSARIAAAGWGGDRSAVYVKGDEVAFAVHVRYDSAPLADRGGAALVSGMKKTLGETAFGGPTGTCFERKDLGPLIVARKGADLVLASGPARTNGGTWTSASTCAVAKKWATEILGGF